MTTVTPHPLSLVRNAQASQPIVRSDVRELVGISELVDGLQDGATWAERELLTRFTNHVERVLTRILGGTSELDDLAQEVFFRVLTKIDTLNEADALAGFVTSIAVFVAREAIRKRKRKRWLVFSAPEELPEVHAPGISQDAREALGSFYRVIRTLDEESQVFFTLRFVEGMELLEIAEATQVSLATVKRRIKDAEATFVAKAKRDGGLEGWLKEGAL